MGLIAGLVEKAKSQGTVPFIMWVVSKFFLGLGIAFLVAGAFPGYGWLFWGLIFVILGVIFAFPMMKVFLRKR